MKLEASIVIDDSTLRELAEAVAPFVAPLISRAGGNDLLRLPAVIAMTGLTRSQIYRSMWSGAFPSAVKIGKRAVAWKQAEIMQWISARPSS